MGSLVYPYLGVYALDLVCAGINQDTNRKLRGNVKAALRDVQVYIRGSRSHGSFLVDQAFHFQW